MGQRVHTAAIKTVHPQDVKTTHLLGHANGYIGVGDGNNGRLTVLGEGIPVVQTDSSEEEFKMHTYNNFLFS